MTFLMSLKCDAEGCETTVSAAFNPGNALALSSAAKNLGWYVAPMMSRHLCPTHAIVEKD